MDADMDFSVFGLKSFPRDPSKGLMEISSQVTFIFWVVHGFESTLIKTSSSHLKSTVLDPLTIHLSKYILFTLRRRATLPFSSPDPLSDGPNRRRDTVWRRMGDLES